MDKHPGIGDVEYGLGGKGHLSFIRAPMEGGPAPERQWQSKSSIRLNFKIGMRFSSLGLSAPMSSLKQGRFSLWSRL